MSRKNYLSIEEPDASATVDFLSDGCTVRLSITSNRLGNKSLWVKALGHDDRVSILIDTGAEIPKPDDRH